MPLLKGTSSKSREANVEKEISKKTDDGLPLVEARRKARFIAEQIQKRERAKREAAERRKKDRRKKGRMWR